MTTFVFWMLGLVGGECWFVFSVFAVCSFRRAVVLMFCFSLPLQYRVRVYRIGVSPLQTNELFSFASYFDGIDQFSVGGHRKSDQRKERQPYGKRWRVQCG